MAAIYDHSRFFSHGFSMQQKLASLCSSGLLSSGHCLFASWVVIFAIATHSFSEEVPVIFTVDNTQSQIEIEVSAAGDSDTDSTSVSGTLNTLLSVDTTSGSPNVTGLEFNGGRIEADDNLSFTLTVLIFSTLI